MWPVDEVDDGEEPPVPDFMATEARIGAHYYEPLGVILSRGEGVWAWDPHWKRHVPAGQAEIFECADNFHGRTRGITGFSTDAAAREHFGPFALARVLEEGDHDIIWKQLASY